jgi:hypothetical protein
MKKRVLFLMVFGLTSLVMGGKVVPLADLIKPDSIVIDESQIYITDDIMICIYNLEDFTLKKRFGQEGEGPGEFLRNRQTGNPPLSIDVQTENLMVNSLNKISIFSKQGKFVNEHKVLDRGDKFVPLGNGFAGEGDLRTGTTRYVTVNIYDRNVKKIKQVFQVLHPLQKIGAGFRMLSEPRIFISHKNRLFVTLDNEFIIRTYDSQGNLKNQIKLDYIRIKVSGKDRERVDKYLKNHPRIKELYSLLKPIHFPEYYPAIRDMRIVEDKIYLVSWKKRDQSTECMVLNLQGRMLKQVFLPIRYVDELEIYPFTFKNNRLYQLVENSDEEWELQVTEINLSEVGSGT